MSKFSLKLEFFEGPLDLLLHLLEKNKVNIYDIPISDITDQYIEYLEKVEEMDLELSSEFLVMAANLLYIKSKMLLPQETDSDENDEDPRQELVDKLLEYKKYKEIADYFDERQNNFKYVFYKEPEPIDIDSAISELVPMSIDDLIKAFNNIFISRSRFSPPSKTSFDGIVKREQISIKEKTKEVMKLLNYHKQIRFIEVFKNKRTKPQIVATFLAILELIKMNRILVMQRVDASDIYLVGVF